MHFLRTYGRLSLLVFIAYLQPGIESCRLQAANNDTDVVTKITMPVKVDSASQPVIPLAESVQGGLRMTRADSLKIQSAKDSLAYKPDPKKALWYSALCPGLGQLYNRRYWKLPFVGAGVVGVAYAIGWNSKYYNAYTNAYRDISDDDPTTTSYLDLLAPGTSVTNTSYLTTVLKNRQQKYRRSRDLSYMGAVGVYVICLLDAFVDAQLYDFDISPDLTVTPANGTNGFGGIGSVELSLAFRF
jgi:hypothetical protein